MQLVQKYPQASFWGIDHDKVEERNLATQQYLLPHVGLPKTGAIQILIGMKARKVTYSHKTMKVTKASDMDCLIENATNPILMIDCFDNAESRKILKDYSSTLSILHVGFSPKYAAEIIWNENYTVPNNIPKEQNDICEMSDAVPFINFVVSLACMTISDFIETGIKNDLLIVNKNRIKFL
jgi:hypothetical protein